jgi:neutral ceramidase
MSLTTYARLAVIVTLLGALVSGGQAAEIQAGIAQVDITPPIGGNTVGYRGAEPTDGVHDPVSARVLVLESGSLRIALVVMDLCVFNSPWLHEQMQGIGIDRLLLMNTHTHAGPSMRQLDFPTEENPWRKTVEQRLLETIKQAKQDLFPASFAAADGEIQLGYNRLVQKGLHSETYFENPERIPYGSVDPTVGVIRITDEQSVVRAVLVHYACHPVVLGPRNRKISADYPGVMRNLVEEKLGEEATCFFFQGGAGDVNPLFMARGDDREGDFELVSRMGQMLAEEVLEVIDGMQAVPAASEGIVSTSSQMKFRNRWKPDEEMTLGVTTLLINQKIAIFTMPGEPFHQFQVDFRQKAGVENTYLFGYCCNGPYAWPSYIPDIVSAARGGYGASDTTRAEVGAGERLVNQGLAQLFELQGRLKSEPQRHTFE